MSNCNNCAEHKEEKKMPETIPYIVYEAEKDRDERRHKEEIQRLEKQVKRWMTTCFVLLGIVVAMLTGFMIYESQFETISYTQDGEGLNNVNVGEQGDINYGAEGSVETETEQ